MSDVIVCLAFSGSAIVAVIDISSMPKPGSMVSILSQSRSREPFDVAHGRCCPDAHSLGTAIDAVADQIEAPGAKSFGFEFFAELSDELSDIASNRLRCANRFGEGPTHFHEFGRTDRHDDLDTLTDRLIEAASQLRTKT